MCLDEEKHPIEKVVVGAVKAGKRARALFNRKEGGWEKKVQRPRNTRMRNKGNWRLNRCGTQKKNGRGDGKRGYG